MIDAADIESAVRAVGGTVVKEEDPQLGFPVLRAVVEDNEAAIWLLTKLAELDAAQGDLRRVAYQIVGSAFAPLARAKVIQAYVQRTVPFIPESEERFQNPLYTLRWGGDCDDHARLVAALNRAVGNTATCEPTFAPREDGIRHVAPRVRIGGVWHWSETTCAAEWDEHPRAAGMRLGLIRTDILGG